MCRLVLLNKNHPMLNLTRVVVSHVKYNLYLRVYNVNYINYVLRVIYVKTIYESSKYLCSLSLHQIEVSISIYFYLSVKSDVLTIIKLDYFYYF